MFRVSGIVFRYFLFEYFVFFCSSFIKWKVLVSFLFYWGVSYGFRGLIVYLAYVVRGGSNGIGV